MDPAVITILVLAGVAFLFVTELVPIAVTAMSGSVILCLTGVISTKEAFSGFSNETVLLFAGMFVIGAAMMESGLTEVIGTALVRRVGSNERSLMIALMILTMVMSAFANNTATVACLMPMVIGVCTVAGLKSSTLLMSLAIAANCGCMTTMIGTPPNMLVQVSLESAKFSPFGFFDFAFVGLPICAAVLVFMYLFGDALLPAKKHNTFGRTGPTTLPGTPRQRWQSVAILVFVIGGIVIGIPGVPPSLLALIGALLCILTRTITEKQAIKGIDWATLFLFAGMLPIAAAMTKTGAGLMVAQFFCHLLGNSPSPYLLLTVLFLLSATLTQFMPNTATAALLIPIGLSISQQAGVSPYPIAMGITIAASCSFMTPVATPPNMLILVSTGFHFKDYLRIGIPITLLCCLISLVIIPQVWPF